MVGPLLTLVVAVSLALTGCSDGPILQRDAPTSGAVSHPSAPATLSLTTPESAVRSYLDWTDYAYRIGASDVATRTMGPSEEVRVNSYLEMNKEQGRLIDQRLVSITFGQGSVDGTTATLPAHEQWRYRYLSLADEKPQSPLYSATYDTTYTVVATGPGHWVVEDVEAKSRGTLK